MDKGRQEWRGKAQLVTTPCAAAPESCPTAQGTSGKAIITQPPLTYRSTVTGVKWWSIAVSI